ncbi:hypothetical protein WG68_18245 [Arsukibacterium ikkense]|uniref:Thiamine biosynthesis protein ThiS n=1 Tax=Arsukibacterium ikkense TaxID=336831 RepID=A0A0M2V453_9GAMM|nr:sulfur carrier protein ThiS [Arsukibacterium ikkense]KKO43948.1 hypothetical protein WG68_18245 [Arsukibacterium ikkense]
MHITLNAQPLEIASSCTVTELLQQHQLTGEGLAVAINDAVIVKRCWSAHILQPNDVVQLFQIVTGG